MNRLFVFAMTPLLALSITACTGNLQPSAALPSESSLIAASGEDPATSIEMVARGDAGEIAYDLLLDSYYAGQSDPAWTYFQNRSITRFLAGWVKETTGNIDDPQWYYDSFTTIELLDHDFAPSRPDELLYCCTFSDGADRYGYIIVTYVEDGPALKQWGVTETTPHQYDLQANLDEILAGLAATDIDLSTATASRVYFYDRENKRADQVIRFTDAKGDNYLYYFGDTAFRIEKYE